MREGNHKQQIVRIATVFLCMLLIVALMPIQSNAEIKKGKSKKAKAKYSISVKNINSDTVIKKGSKLKIQYKALCKKGKAVKKAKVGFKSSNKKIATVSSKGVIKAKKKGTVKVTVYCKRSPKKKKTIKIKVGTPVSEIELSGYKHLRIGRKTAIKIKMNSNATNKKVTWASDNPSVVRIDSSGNISALRNGKATIYATATDGSGKKGSITIGVEKYSKSDTRWIAHRGLHTSAIENTADAFRAAGLAEGFWGCECDIWETKHEVIVTDSQDQTEMITTDPLASVQPVDMNNESNADSAEDMENTSDEANADSTEETEKEESSIEETFDIVINHDDTFKRTLGKNVTVKSMTASEIRDQLPKACFFDEYLDICKQYDMVPVVEFKDSQMSDEAINKAVEMLEERGQLESALLISFYPDILEKAKACADGKLDGKSSYTAFLTGDKDFNKALSISKEKGFSCISSHYGQVDLEAYERCKAEGLGVGTWTYWDSLNSDEMLYTHLKSGKFMLDFATVDYKPW